MSALREAQMTILRERAAEMGLDPATIEGFAAMDWETLVLQAALWHAGAIRTQKRAAEQDERSGQVVQGMLDLCREHDIVIPDDTVERIITMFDPVAAPLRPPAAG